MTCITCQACGRRRFTAATLPEHVARLATVCDCGAGAMRISDGDTAKRLVDDFLDSGWTDRP
jgi:hypothetical protein